MLSWRPTASRPVETDLGEYIIQIRHELPSHIIMHAVPPQTLLLVVTPEETGSWSWDDLVGTLHDTLARAKRRAVEPAQLETNGLVWNALAPALVSEFSTIVGADVSLDLMTATKFAGLHEFYAAHTTP